MSAGTVDDLRATAVEVAVRNLGKRFRDAMAVHDLSLTIRRGEFFTFLGPSGCGKTTTLRMIAGLVAPDAGDILFDGRPVTRTPPWQRNIGMVFQNYALWPHMTVFDNVAFGLVERRVPREGIGRRVEDALRLVGLEGLGHRLPSQLSGGQQQRVALARAIVVQPSLLLLDEPLSNLDARLRVQMRTELVKLQRHLGITTVYVTHDQEEALLLSQRIAVMHAGRLVQLGTPQEVFERPADAFVADFLGGTNFLPGVVREVSPEGVSVALDGSDIVRADRARNPDAAPGDRVLVCLRPEVLEITAPGHSTGSPNALSGRLTLRQYLGQATACEVELGGGALVRAQMGHSGGRARLPEDGPVVLRFDPRDVLLLRRTT